jgi:hypothetical protein
MSISAEYKKGMPYEKSDAEKKRTPLDAVPGRQA